jgi:alpha-glucosidase
MATLSKWPIACTALIVAYAAPQPSNVRVTSPDRDLSLQVTQGSEGLSWSVRADATPVIESSALGITVDGRDLGKAAILRGTQEYRINDSFPWRGATSEMKYRANGTRIRVSHTPSQTDYTIDVRVSDAAVAVRFVVPGSGSRVPDAGMAFTIPAGAMVWSHGLRDHYEAMYEKKAIEQVPAEQWAAPPVTFKLPAGGGYASIMEANLRNYAGMALQSDGPRVYRERLGHSHPAGYPYTLRYGETNAKRLSVPAAVEGIITTPWRVITFGRDLNTLVNSTAVPGLADPHDPSLFPLGARTAWLKHGRAVWRYLDGGENTVAGIKEFSRLAGQLGFEHQVVEGQWQKWTDAELSDVIEYSKTQGVGIWLWRHSNTLGDSQKRRELFARVQGAGAVGLKVDFLDHEAKEVIDLYQAILADAAAHKLMINFHGANKPAGESKTWPNEMTREGIYGLEHRKVVAWGAFNATFPFVRMLAGHADYTPVVFGERRKETSWAHQIASAAILTSPLLVYGGHPASLLASSAVEVIKSIPSVWDETRVLPPSEIGELALFARRSGTRWFIAAMNGPGERTVKVDLSFLPKGTYNALVVRDRLDNDAAVEVETRQVREAIEIPMRASGGFVVRLTR